LFVEEKSKNKRSIWALSPFKNNPIFYLYINQLVKQSD